MYFRRAPARLALRATGHADCASLLPVPLARQELIKLIYGDNALDALDALDEGPFKGISRTSVFASPVCYRYAQRAEYGLSVWSAAMERITSSLSAASSR